MQAIGEAARNGAELAVFSEVWLAGYPFWTEGWDSKLPGWVAGRVAFRDAALLVPSDDTDRIGAAARQHNIYVVIGCNEIDPRPESDTIYNTLLFFGRDGALMGKHRKLMPTFSERQFWGMGDGHDIKVFETDIGRLGGLICGEHVMTLARAAMIAEGEEIHVAVFPGAFALHTGPRLEELDTSGAFWGHSSVRAHAFEAGAFVLSACGMQDPKDISDEFPHKKTMNIGYAQGGSSVIAPLATSRMRRRCRLSAKASFFESGLHTGSNRQTPPSVVSRRAAPPPCGRRYTSYSPVSSERYAIHWPSGDHVGAI